MQTHTRQDVAGTRAHVLTRQLSEAMIEIGEGCTAGDLKRRGFTQRDIDRHGEAATARANALSKFN